MTLTLARKLIKRGRLDNAGQIVVLTALLLLAGCESEAQQQAYKRRHELTMAQVKGIIYITTSLIHNVYSIADIILDSLAIPCL